MANNNPEGRRQIDPAELVEFQRLAAVHRNAEGGPNYSAISRIMRKPRSTIQRWPLAEREANIEFPSFVTDGEEEEPIEELLGRFQKQYERKKRNAASLDWFEIKVREKLPYGILWFGDPHLGPHCDWETLHKHIEIANRPGVYGANIGDTTDSWPWTGRMAKLWADNDISHKTERRLASWFMFEAGISWLVWLLGNHDKWNNTEFYKELGANYVPLVDWRARFTLVHDSGARVKIDAAHGRKGNSIYNPTHGTLRDAKFGEDADLFVTGHIHTFGLFDYEMPERRTRTWLAQVSGYKTFDHYALVNGFAQSRHGSGILSVIDPHSGSVQCFADVEEGADYLAFKRGGI